MKSTKPQQRTWEIPQDQRAVTLTRYVFQERRGNKEGPAAVWVLDSVVWKHAGHTCVMPQIPKGWRNKWRKDCGMTIPHDESTFSVLSLSLASTVPVSNLKKKKKVIHQMAVRAILTKTNVVFVSVLVWANHYLRPLGKSKRGLFNDIKKLFILKAW